MTGGGHADACGRRVKRIYGAGALQRPAGVVHIAAVWREPGGGQQTIAINDSSPTSETDRFVLGLSRARADAVVTTGRNLRLEPQLDHALGATPDGDVELRAWRREQLGVHDLPRSVVLSSCRDLSFEHPLFRRAVAAGAPTPLIFTSEEMASVRREEGLRAGIELVGRPQAGLRDCLVELLDGRGVRTISMEVGSTTARELYRESPLVDELLLSVFEEPVLVGQCRGPEFVSAERIRTRFPSPPSRFESREESGRWSFLRYRG